MQHDNGGPRFGKERRKANFPSSSPSPYGRASKLPVLEPREECTLPTLSGKPYQD